MYQVMSCSDRVLPSAAELMLGQQSNPQDRQLKLAVLGTNVALHRLVCTLHGIYERDAEAGTQLFTENVDLRLFIIPTGRNDLASFLAWSDKMYRLRVFTAFSKVPSFTPLYQPSVFEPDFSQEVASTLPAMLQRDAFEDYIRFANQLYPVVVWKCICWNTSTSADNDEGAIDAFNAFNATPDLVVPFVMSAELGIHAQAQHFRKSQAAKDDKAVLDMSLEELLSDKYRGFQDKLLDKNHGELSVHQWPVVEDSGQAAAEIASEGDFFSLSIRNLPECCGDERYGKDLKTETLGANAPNHKSVSVYARKHDDATRKAITAFRGGKLLNTNPLAETMRDERGEGTVLDHLGKVEVNSRVPFPVLIDGVVYGPFTKISVVRSELVLPIASYFPISDAS